jgi:hypothetical protein
MSYRGTRLGKSNTQQPTPNIEPSTFDTQRSTPNSQLGMSLVTPAAAGTIRTFTEENEDNEGRALRAGTFRAGLPLRSLRCLLLRQLLFHPSTPGQAGSPPYSGFPDSPSRTGHDEALRAPVWGQRAAPFAPSRARGSATVPPAATRAGIPRRAGRREVPAKNSEHSTLNAPLSTYYELRCLGCCGN